MNALGVVVGYSSHPGNLKGKEVKREFHGLVKDKNDNQRLLAIPGVDVHLYISAVATVCMICFAST